MVLGEGVRTFETGLRAPLTLIEERRLAVSDIVLLRYAFTPREQDQAGFGEPRD